MISISLLNGAKSLIRGEYKEMMSGIGSIKSKVMNNYQIGKRLAEIKGYHKIPTITNSIFTKTKITKKELPALMALGGTFTPIPGGSFACYYLGKMVNKVRL